MFSKITKAAKFLMAHPPSKNLMAIPDIALNLDPDSSLAADNWATCVGSSSFLDKEKQPLEGDGGLWISWRPKSLTYVKQNCTFVILR